MFLTQVCLELGLVSQFCGGGTLQWDTVSAVLEQRQSPGGVTSPF